MTLPDDKPPATDESGSIVGRSVPLDTEPDAAGASSNRLQDPDPAQSTIKLRSGRFAWMRDKDGQPTTRLFEAITAMAAVATIVVSVIALSTAQDAKMISQLTVETNSSTTTVTNNYYSADGAPGEANPKQNGNCGDADSSIVGGWGPDRPVFVMTHPPSYTTMNAIRNNPQLGDERGFMRVADTSTGEQLDYEAQVEEGHTYRVSIFVENSALDGVPELASTDTNLSVNLPVCAGQRIAANAFLKSGTAFPGTIWGGVTFVSDRLFNLSYVEGSAKLINNVWPEGLALNGEEELFTSQGVDLGYNELDGVMQTGYQYALYVDFEVRPQFASNTP